MDGEVQFLVDGIEWSKEEAYAIPYQNLESVHLRSEQYQKYDTDGQPTHRGPENLIIKISRKKG